MDPTVERERAAGTRQRVSTLPEATGITPAMTTSISSISDLLKILEGWDVMNAKDSHVRAWFRGHASKTWKLRPGVCRDDFAKNETDRRNNERHLSQDFRIMSASLRDPHLSNPEIYFLQQ